jgi:hypothetical protein
MPGEEYRLLAEGRGGWAWFALGFSVEIVCTQKEQ